MGCEGEAGKGDDLQVAYVAGEGGAGPAARGRGLALRSARAPGEAGRALAVIASMPPASTSPSCRWPWGGSAPEALRRLRPEDVAGRLQKAARAASRCKLSAFEGDKRGCVRELCESIVESRSLKLPALPTSI